MPGYIHTKPVPEHTICAIGTYSVTVLLHVYCKYKYIVCSDRCIVWAYGDIVCVCAGRMSLYERTYTSAPGNVVGNTLVMRVGNLHFVKLHYSNTFK